METKQMIEVMQAYANGEKIEEMDRFAVSGWRPFQGTWNWAYLTFRIAPEPEPKKEGRWEQVEIRIFDGEYSVEFALHGSDYELVHLSRVNAIPGFGGIDYRSPFDPKVIVWSMVPPMFDPLGATITSGFSGYETMCRPGIPVAAWFWREE